jgi:hypothetical protein
VSWLRGRVVGEATVTARCAQVGHSRSLACLRKEVLALVVRHQSEDLDGSAIRLRAPRAFTQHVSRFVHECTTEDGAAQLDGIHYLSRFGEDLENIAVFELPSGDDPVSAGMVAPISLDDPALQDAPQHHDLAWFDDTAD